MALVTVRYFGGAAAAAGMDEGRYEALTVRDLLDLIGERHGSGLQRVLAAASVLVDETVARDRGLALRDGQTIDILPPFAGG